MISILHEICRDLLSLGKQSITVSSAVQIRRVHDVGSECVA